VCNTISAHGLLALATNVVGSWLLSESLRKRVEYGESNSAQWATEFEAAAGKCVAWPFTEGIETLGIQMRRVKAGFTLLGGVFLIVGAVLK
jgi:hypothetical protein